MLASAPEHKWMRGSPSLTSMMAKELHQLSAHIASFRRALRALTPLSNGGPSGSHMGFFTSEKRAAPRIPSRGPEGIPTSAGSPRNSTVIRADLRRVALIGSRNVSSYAPGDSGTKSCRVALLRERRVKAALIAELVCGGRTDRLFGGTGSSS